MAQYHCKARKVRRSGGKTASAQYQYLAREGRYSKGERGEELELCEHGNMPKWTGGDGEVYWRAADKYEGKNRVLAVKMTIALPRELSVAENRELARRLGHAVADRDRLPYSVTFHAKEGNNHCDILYSERALDGHDRTPEKWFKLAKPKRPASGGAPKLKIIRSKEWLRGTRKLAATIINDGLARAGRTERVDHRTLAAQRDDALARGDFAAAEKLNRVPGVHKGPAMWHRPEAVRGRVHAVRRQEAELEAQHAQLATILQRQVEAAEAAAQVRALELAAMSPTLQAGRPPKPKAHGLDLARVERITIPSKLQTATPPPVEARPPPPRPELAPNRIGPPAAERKPPTVTAHAPPPRPELAPSRIDPPRAELPPPRVAAVELPRQPERPTAPATRPDAATLPAPRDEVLPPPTVPVRPTEGPAQPRTGRERTRGRG